MEEQQLVLPFDIEDIHESVLHKLGRKGIVLVNSAFKRILEMIISLCGIILLIPLSVVVFFQNARNQDYGPIFYTQNRIGKNGKIFKLYKFRTMVKNADEMLEAMLQDVEIRKEYEKYRKLKNDPRITKFGKILREKSLDEFPQFINVFKGEMSLVGPRPYLVEEKERMGTYYNYIIQHKPGISGPYQISGRERIEFNERLDIDYRYHYRQSAILDFKIAIITMLVTLRRRETYKIKDVTLETLNFIRNEITLFIKRIIDIIGALVGIVILIPLTVCVSIGNRISGDKGPIFFSQDRIGKDGKIFKMYKFRSMIVGADEVLNELLVNDEVARAEYQKFKKLKNDPRITKMGNILRKTSLDEFPQFINVLKGEMSLVGPRAYLEREREDMGEAYSSIVRVKPGVTGLWQVSGRSSVSFSNRLDMDIEYFENYNLGLDIEILFKTVISITKKEGAI